MASTKSPHRPKSPYSPFQKKQIAKSPKWQFGKITISKTKSPVSLFWKQGILLLSLLFFIRLPHSEWKTLLLPIHAHNYIATVKPPQVYRVPCIVHSTPIMTSTLKSVPLQAASTHIRQKIYQKRDHIRHFELSIRCLHRQVYVIFLLSALANLRGKGHFSHTILFL